ncbi:hypothetical protein FLA_4319 [Filimonas lacunae]|nr:hypothetical protein FLA_4319 [Filimonas lacunae]
MKGNFNVTPEQLSSLYSFIKDTLNPLSANGSKVLEFATKAEKVGKYSGMPLEEVKEKTELDAAAVEAAIEELIKLDILAPSSYKELYQLNPQNIPQVFSFDAPESELTLNIKLVTGDVVAEAPAAKPAKASKAAAAVATEAQEAEVAE